MTLKDLTSLRRRARGAALALAGFLVLAAAPVRAQDPAADPAAADAPAPAAALDASEGPPAPPAPVPVHGRTVRLDRSDRTIVRTGPGDRYAIAGVFPKGATFPVIAKSGDWYNVRLSSSETGWIHASLCREFDDMSDLEFRPNPRLYARTGSFVLGGYAGAYSFDRKSNSLVLGGRVGYYVLERLQAEGAVAWTHIHRPAEIVESLFGLSLEAEEFHMLFYDLDLTLELLPGRQMVPFLSGGVGSAIMRGDTETSWNLGAGTMLFVSKRVATRWEVRHHRFQSGDDDARVTNNNIEFTFGTALLY